MVCAFGVLRLSCESGTRLPAMGPAEGEQHRTMELYNMEILRRHQCPSVKNRRLAKRSMDQKLRLRNFDAWHEAIGTRAVAQNCKKKSSVRKVTNAV